MSDRSSHLDMPYLQPTQAQKHVTHNEALQQLDAVVQLSVVAFDAVAPPTAPNEGDRYTLAANASGAWAGRDGQVAHWSAPAWHFFTPEDGWRAWGTTENTLRVFFDGAWQAMPMDILGLNAAADSANRLTVSSPNTLLTHAGGGHQLKINKASPVDTASLMFQSNWTGHAEMGLAGNNSWSVKVSPDGTNWIAALSLDSTTGLPTGAAVQQSANDTTEGVLMRADFGFSPGNLLGTVTESAGVPTGAVMESGTTSEGTYVRYADGTQICWTARTYTDVDITVPSGGVYRSELFSVVFPMAFATPPSVTLNGSRLDGAWDVWAVTSAVTATQFNGLHLKMTSDVSQSRSVSYIAIGHWH